MSATAETEPDRNCDAGFCVLLWVFGLEIGVAVLIGDWSFIDQFSPARWMQMLAMALLPIWVIFTTIALILIKNGDVSPLATMARSIQAQRDRLVRGLLLTVLSFPITAAVGAIKMSIPHFQPFYADRALADLDAAIFRTDPWRITHAIIGPVGTVVIDRVYLLWFFEFFGLMAFLNFTRKRVLQVQGLLSLWLSWALLGNILALAAASVGPLFYQSFYHDGRFDELTSSLAAVGKVHYLAVLPTAEYLRSALVHGKVGGGISAMPSLHVGIAYLSFMVCRELRKPWLSWVSGLFAAVIWVGSVHLGWHYATDGAVSIFGVSIIWFLSGRIAAWQPQRGATVMHDVVRIGERIFLILLCASAIVRLGPVAPYHPQVAMILVSEILGVVLILTQHRGAWTSDPYPTLLAFIGTSAALFVVPAGTAFAPEWVSRTLVFIGFGVAVGAKLFLRRSFSLVPGNRGVKVGGLYRIVRHPMYFGYILAHIGMLSLYLSAWNVAVYGVAWILLYLRIIEEEKFLSLDPQYREYRETVKYRLVPGVF